MKHHSTLDPARASLAPQIVKAEVDEAGALAREAPCAFDRLRPLTERVAKHVGLRLVILAIGILAPHFQNRFQPRRHRNDAIALGLRLRRWKVKVRPGAVEI